MPQKRKRPRKKGEVPDYGIDIDDEVEDMGLDDLFGDYVPPQQEKQIVPKPPTYEESLADVLEGKKEIYRAMPNICLKILRSCHLNTMTMKKLIIAIDDEDLIKGILNDIGIPDYEQCGNCVKSTRNDTPKN